MSTTKPDSETGRHPLAIAWDEWLASAEGREARAANTLPHNMNYYLENRLHRAFDAGAKAVTISPSDFEQLIRLRKAAFTTIERLDAERKRLCGYCEGEERWGHLWDAVALDHVWNREGDKFNGQRLKCRAKEIQSAIAALREALAPKGEKS